MLLSDSVYVLSRTRRHKRDVHVPWETDRGVEVDEAELAGEGAG